MRLSYKQLEPTQRFSGQVNSKANEDCTLFRCSVCKDKNKKEWVVKAIQYLKDTDNGSI